ncbi:Predicted membrane protein [Phaffia rhodozyma]|uniref:Golgi apparatus membrane protein TVP38 n=1 Tax=Phaffia rhodozyma TaxID=264483 RepID=A0A0F7SE83_PHARH|nr:Predicted membrane protein [Phaffia rhodozyma]
MPIPNIRTVYADYVVPSFEEGVRYLRSAPDRYRKLSTPAKFFAWSLVLFHVVLITAIVQIGPKAIGDFFTTLAENLKALGFLGYVIVGTFIVIASIPPFFGFSSALTFAGFTYGFFRAIPVAFVSTVIGSSIAFLAYQYLLKNQFKGIVGSQKVSGGKWEAFQLVVKSRSLPLLCALRWCPLPFALSNAFYGTLEVSYSHFLIATLGMLPRTMMIIFVGSRLDGLADSKERQKMDGASRALNIFSVVLAMCVSAGTGWWIYNQVLAHLPAHSVSLSPSLTPSPLSLERPLAEPLEGDAYSDSESDLGPGFERDLEAGRGRGRGTDVPARSDYPTAGEVLIDATPSASAGIGTERYRD